MHLSRCPPDPVVGNYISSITLLVLSGLGLYGKLIARDAAVLGPTSHFFELNVTQAIREL
jgi:hypothetical protein